MTGPVLRKATPSDLPAIARLQRVAFFTAMPHMPVLHTPEEDLAFYENVVFPRSEIWLSEASAEISGFIAFRPGWIEHLYIHPAHQRNGLGASLLERVKQAFGELQLWTFQCNAPARRFYEKHSFTEERRTAGENDEKQPDVLYVWKR